MAAGKSSETGVPLPMIELTVGTKYDQGKLRWDLMPPEIEEVVKVLTYGASKYDDRNWEKGINYGRLIAATLRHLWAWIRGERNDPETGLHHLAHANCDILFLLTYEQRGLTDFDDRPNTGRGDGALVPSWEPGVQFNIPAPSYSQTRSELEGSYGLTDRAERASRKPGSKRELNPLDESVYTAP